MPPTNQAGFSLVEVFVSVTIFTIGFVGLASLQVSTEQTNLEAREEAVVRNAFRNLAERIRATPFESAVSTFQGTQFSVDGIQGVGSVTFHLNERTTGNPATAFGFPRDLNGDGDATDSDVSSDYMLLPVELELLSSGASGTQVRRLYFLLSAEE